MGCDPREDVMIVECENCGSTFRLDESLVKSGGTKVRCSLCETTFVVYPSEKLPDSTDEKADAAYDVKEALHEKVSTVEFIDSDSEGIDEDEQLEAELDSVFTDAFRESSMGQFRGEQAPSKTAHNAEDDPGGFKAIIESEAPVANPPYVDLSRMSGLDDDSVEEELEASFEAQESSEEDLDVPMEAVKKEPIKKRKSVGSRIITVVLVIFLLILAAAAALVFLKPQWIPPSLSFLKPPVKKQVSDAGVRLLMFKGVSGSFVETEKAGNLFVIRGEVSSKYRKPRSYILIKGNILDGKGQVIKSELSYAANTFTDDELKTITYGEIKRAMRNKDGMARQNFNVPPGASIPFMIAFQNLPDNLSEFTVEAVSSSPGS